MHGALDFRDVKFYDVLSAVNPFLKAMNIVMQFTVVS